MQNYPRYAVYFAPDPGSRWWDFACHWLGRDPLSGRSLEQLPVNGYAAESLFDLTAEPRRYGFHATLKAPFALAPGVGADELYRAAAAFASRQQDIPLGPLVPQYMGSYLALRPEPEPPGLDALARDCVEHFDALRAAPDDADLQRRRAAGLTPRQETLLARWGYPYVMEEYRYHMTLTGELPKTEAESLSAWLLPRLDKLNEEPLPLDAISIFEQLAPGMPFMLTGRFGFDGVVTRYRRGRPGGHLYYVVGPSGAGKDSLLRYARERLADRRRLVFAHRYITRAADAGGENHVALSEAEFAARIESAAFAMHWRSHGHAYGIGVEIESWLEQGLDVVISGSREHLAEAGLRYPDMTVIWIEASPQNLRSRLAGRGREGFAAMESRLSRAARFTPREDAIVIRNDSTLEQAGEHLLRVLSGAAVSR